MRGDLSPLFVDYYLHLADQQLKPDAGQDRLFKAALAFQIRWMLRSRLDITVLSVSGEVAA